MSHRQLDLKLRAVQVWQDARKGRWSLSGGDLSGLFCWSYTDVVLLGTEPQQQERDDQGGDDGNDGYDDQKLNEREGRLVPAERVFVRRGLLVRADASFNLLGTGAGYPTPGRPLASASSAIFIPIVKA